MACRHSTTYPMLVITKPESPKQQFHSIDIWQTMVVLPSVLRAVCCFSSFTARQPQVAEIVQRRPAGKLVVLTLRNSPRPGGVQNTGVEGMRWGVCFVLPRHLWPRPRRIGNQKSDRTGMAVKAEHAKVTRDCFWVSGTLVQRLPAKTETLLVVTWGLDESHGRMTRMPPQAKLAAHRAAPILLVVPPQVSRQVPEFRARYCQVVRIKSVRMS